MGGERGEERGRNREGRRGEGREEEGREGWEGRGPQVLVYTPIFSNSEKYRDCEAALSVGGSAESTGSCGHWSVVSGQCRFPY